jgi:hypothetical protein
VRRTLPEAGEEPVYKYYRLQEKGSDRR